MWLLTPRGFYSAVVKPWDREDGMITVRSRVKADLENLPEVPDYPPVTPESIATDELADYRYRVRIPRQQWMQMVAAMAGEIDYPDFKNEVQRRQGRERHDAYLSVWSALLRLQPRREPRWSELAEWAATQPFARTKARKKKGKKGKKGRNGRSVQQSLFGPTPSEQALAWPDEGLPF